MIIRSILGLIVSAALLLGGSESVFAADANATPVLSRIVSSGKLRVGMTGGQAPFNMKNKQGQMIGMEVDLARLLASSMGVELEIVQKPFAELLPALKSGEIDMIMSGMTSTLERNLQAAFVGPYYVTGKSILTKSSTLAAADEADDLNASNVRLAALEGSTSQRFVEGLLPEAQLVKTSNYEEAVQKVLDGEVDALVADMPVCILSVLRNPGAGLATLTKPLTLEPIGIALPPGDALLVNLVENYLGALDATGLLDGLSRKWFEDGDWLTQVP